LRFDVGALGVAFDPGVDMGIEGNEESIGLILVKDFDPLGIVLMIEKIDIFFDQFDGGFIDSAMKGDGSVPVDFTSGPDAKEIGEVFRGGPQEVKVLGVAVPRGLFRRAMDASMIGLVTPLFEPFVESRERKGGRKKGKKLHS
jgi:hypothetical protein